MILVLFSLVCVMLLIKSIIVLWHKMHALVGIEVGHPQEAFLLPYQNLQAIPMSITAQSSIEPKKSRHRYWQTPYGRIYPLHCLTGVNAKHLTLMPKKAIELLVSINERAAQYLTWHQQSQQSTKQQVIGATLTNWLTEKQFVIERLINQTIPEAVNQYDQLARFSPQRLSQPIHDDLTAGEVLIAVLQTVDEQIKRVLDEVFIQAGSQLATTYRYVKTRTS